MSTLFHHFTTVGKNLRLKCLRHCNFPTSTSRSGSCTKATAHLTSWTPSSPGSTATRCYESSASRSTAPRARLRDGRPCPRWFRCSPATQTWPRRSPSPVISPSGRPARTAAAASLVPRPVRRRRSLRQASTAGSIHRGRSRR
jgi:hypothetical protein